MNKKLSQYLAQIIGIDLQETMRRRNIFAQYHLNRVKYLEGLQKQGLKGSDYSDAVIEYDKQFQTKLG